MSIELVEAFIFAEQMNKELPGKTIASCTIDNYENLQKMLMFNKNTKIFDDFIGRKIKSVKARGNTIWVKLDKKLNLLVGPEYGGRIRIHENEDTLPKKFHVRLNFTDKTILTVRLLGMGVINAVYDENLEDSYMYKRDFLYGISPLEDELFTFESFSRMLSDRNQNMKTILVGKEAYFVGISNSAFQEIIYKAKIHPKRKSSELSKMEQRALFKAVKTVISSRLKKGGKDKFEDLYGNAGRHTPFMGPNMKGKTCLKCGANIEKLAFGGGQVYFCPTCQV
jgi:formamidopyrimidine-DNA glycosylase